ncbi:MAG: PHP domain-containing protein [Deltaproteobacteria bacterium]|nr:PHP domain-containing protein [Deltaproteobacteria bacterium]
MAGRPVAAQESPALVVDEPVPGGDVVFFLVPFSVGAGVAELEVRHAVVDGDDDDVLDFGLQDAAGAYRGWGGGNPEPATVGVRAASRGYIAGPLPEGTWHVVVGRARLSSTAPRVLLEFFLRATPTLPDDGDQAQVAPTTLSTEARWYAGDLHVHSRDSGDARPDLDEVATFARGRGLDFVVITDHNTNAQVAHLDEAQARHPGLLLVPGVEFTTYNGHAGGFGVTDYVDHKVGLSTTLQAAVDAIHAQGALFSINHPVLDLGDVCIGCAWTQAIPDAVDAVEVATGGYRQSGFIFGADARDFWDRLLDDGSHAAPVGGSDDHKAGVDLEAFGSPIGDPTTMIFARDQTTAALLDGIRCNRTVVKLQGPDDPMVDLQTSPARDCDTVVVDAGASVTLRATVTGGVGLRARLLKDGYEDGAVVDIDADPLVLERRVAAPAPDAADERWRVELLDGDTPRVVSGHVWTRTGAADVATSCGCRGAPDTAALGCVALKLLAGRRRRRAASR